MNCRFAIHPLYAAVRHGAACTAASPPAPPTRSCRYLSALATSRAVATSARMSTRRAAGPCAGRPVGPPPPVVPKCDMQATGCDGEPLLARLEKEAREGPGGSAKRPLSRASCVTATRQWCDGLSQTGSGWTIRYPKVARCAIPRCAVHLAHTRTSPGASASPPARQATVPPAACPGRSTPSLRVSDTHKAVMPAFMGVAAYCHVVAFAG